jgi:hypothetical protein
VDDREVLCLAMLQELLGCESDHAFYQWLDSNPVMRRLFLRRLSRPNWADRRAGSHPVDVCRPMMAGRRKRLGGLVQRGYCASVRRWSHGVREHLIFTPGGRIVFVLQVPGNRHDIHGLYALMKTAFRGHLHGNNAYWPRVSKRAALEACGITVTEDL